MAYDEAPDTVELSKGLELNLARLHEAWLQRETFPPTVGKLPLALFASLTEEPYDLLYSSHFSSLFAKLFPISYL